MNVLLTVAVWGRSYAETFVRYGLASQLSPGNIPQLLKDHKLVYHVVTTRSDAQWMREHPNFRRLLGYCDVIWDYLEDLGFLLERVPDGMDSEKYPFMSRLQNIAFERSLEYDVLVFNYADFIWADGSIPGTVALVDPEVDAILGFCPPVDSTDGKRALDAMRSTGGASHALAVSSRDLAGVIVDHLHAETKLRIWDGPDFTTTPTYIIWPVDSEGLVVRAYHQTIFALRVRADDPNYRAGIRRGTLDGYFSAELAEHGCVRFAADSDQVLVFSLYDDISSTRLRKGRTREEAVEHCLRHFVSAGQRGFADHPMLVKRQFLDAAKWEEVTERSGRILTELHGQVPSDSGAFLKSAGSHDISALENEWRVTPRAVKRIGVVSVKAANPLAVGIASVLRTLYIGRLVRLYIVPLLRESQQQLFYRFASRAPRLVWIDLLPSPETRGARLFRTLFRTLFRWARQ